MSTSSFIVLFAMEKGGQTKKGKRGVDVGYLCPMYGAFRTKGPQRETKLV